MSGWTEEFENALAWYAAAPKRLVGSVNEAIAAAEAGWDQATQAVKDAVSDAAQWVWEVIQGDFAEDHSAGQIVVGTVISMIPFVDQICDIRDIVANSMKIYNHDEEKEGSAWHLWLALVITLIGFIPCVGSFFKGCFKVLFRYVRKGFDKTAGKVGIKLWDVSAPYIERGLGELNKFLQRPEVKKAIVKMRLDNIYLEIAKAIRKAAAAMNPRVLLDLFDELVHKMKAMLAFVKKYGPQSVVKKAEMLIKAVESVRKGADKALAWAMGPMTEFLEKVAKRLDDEHKAMYSALSNVHNPRAFKRVLEAAEIDAYKKKKASYVDVETKPHPHPEAKQSTYRTARKNGQARIDQALKNGQLKPPADITPPDLESYPIKDAYKTFSNKDLHVDVLPGNTKIYRVLDPGSADNSHCWMTEAEFKKLTSKEDWRRRFAVWVNWNKNGEYVTYTVPPEGMVVWRGTTGTQTVQGSGLMLEGGAEQIVLDPRRINTGVKHLDSDGRKVYKYLSERQSTGWAGGYRDLDETSVDFTGVPVLLETNIRTF